MLELCGKTAVFCLIFDRMTESWYLWLCFKHLLFGSHHRVRVRDRVRRIEKEPHCSRRHVTQAPTQPRVWTCHWQLRKFAALRNYLESCARFAKFSNDVILCKQNQRSGARRLPVGRCVACLARFVAKLWTYMSQPDEPPAGRINFFACENWKPSVRKWRNGIWIKIRLLVPRIGRRKRFWWGIFYWHYRRKVNAACSRFHLLCIAKPLSCIDVSICVRLSSSKCWSTPWIQTSLSLWVKNHLHKEVYNRLCINSADSYCHTVAYL